VTRWITLHEQMNPEREMPVNVEEISAITGLPTGSEILLKGGGNHVLVHETPTEVRNLIEAGE